MASIEKRVRGGQVRWYMRYRDPAGVQRNKTFDRKVDAERFLTTGRVGETDRLLHRPRGIPAHRRDVGTALARRPDALEAVDT